MTTTFLGLKDTAGGLYNYVADAVMVIAENPTNLGYPSVQNKKKFGCPYAKCRATKPLKLVALMTAWLPIQIDPT